MRTLVQSQEKKLEREFENLLENRRLRFREIFTPGWPADDIEALARSEHHPTEAEKLKEQGCDLDLIVKILT